MQHNIIGKLFNDDGYTKPFQGTISLQHNANYHGSQMCFGVMACCKRYVTKIVSTYGPTSRNRMCMDNPDKCLLEIVGTI